MMNNKLSLGIVGVSEGNGHPYSFASIINGYNDNGFEKANWDVIHDYLKKRDESEFGFHNVKVTHAWTQYENETKRLCKAANIPNCVLNVERLHENVDAVIIARDDPESHLRLAQPFLESNIPVFIDKPLTSCSEELGVFKPYLRSGLLMSCSGMRYARELDNLRVKISKSEDVRLINGTIVKDWVRYGMHILDAVSRVLPIEPVAVNPCRATHDSITVEMVDGKILQINALGDAAFTFDIGFYTNKRNKTIELRDNFTAFRRTLYHFIKQIRSGSPAIPPQKTINAVKTIIAGKQALDNDERILIESV